MWIWYWPGEQKFPCTAGAALLSITCPRISKNFFCLLHYQHYVSKAMSNPAKRAGAIMDFMSRGKQLWTPFSIQAPYDEIVFPDDENVKQGAPNEWSHKFFEGLERTVYSVLNSVDPNDFELKIRVKTYLEICLDVYVCVLCAYLSTSISLISHSITTS